MDYLIALHPELGLHAEDFVADWNETPACCEVAQARLVENVAKQFDPTLLAGALAVLGNIALGVAGNALYDLIKQALIRKGVQNQTEIVQIDQPDGTKILVVKIVEQ